MGLESLLFFYDSIVILSIAKDLRQICIRRNTDSSLSQNDLSGNQTKNAPSSGRIFVLTLRAKNHFCNSPSSTRALATRVFAPSTSPESSATFAFFRYS